MTRSTIHVARSVPEALALVAAHGPEAAFLAGATWVMRAPLRGELEARRYIAVARILELRLIEETDDEVRVGSCVTHASLAEALGDRPDLAALRTAAEKSANPQVRSVATIGGNLCTAGFAAADLVTALLCLDASVLIDRQGGQEVMPLAEFLAHGRARLGSGLVTAVSVPRVSGRSAHSRLPLRKAGDYPVAIVSVAAAERLDGTLGHVRVAVGSVEPVPRRWHDLERALEGRPLALDAIADAAETLAPGFTGRDGVEAPGWYRVKVLPALVRRAFEQLEPA